MNKKYWNDYLFWHAELDSQNMKKSIKRCIWPYQCNQMLSKDHAVKSAPNSLPLSTSFLQFYIISEKLCWVQYPFRNQHFLGDNIDSKRV